MLPRVLSVSVVHFTVVGVMIPLFVSNSETQFRHLAVTNNTVRQSLEQKYHLLGCSYLDDVGVTMAVAAGEDGVNGRRDTQSVCDALRLAN